MKTTETIAIGADSFAINLKRKIQEYLAQQGHHLIDLNQSKPKSNPYYKIADQAGNLIVEGTANKAILLCGTGMGMAIIANKHPGVYASVCESVHAAKLSRIINDANILTLGSMLIGEHLAIEMVTTWLNTPFASEFDQEIINLLKTSKQKITQLEEGLFA